MALPLESYRYKTHEEAPCWWIFGLTRFWKVWDMQTMSIGVYAWRNSMQMDRLNSLDLESLETCKSYHMGKMTEILGFSKMEWDRNFLEVTHFDVCNPISAEACSGYRYVLTSQMIWVDVEYIYLINHKSELLKGSSNFNVKLKDHRDKRITYLWYDHRDEYLNYEFGTELRHCGNCFTTNTAWNTKVWWCVRTS